MATKEISSSDVHLIETDEGNIAVTFKVLSHTDFLDSIGKRSNAELVREVTLNTTGLTVVLDKKEVPADQTIDAICNDPGLTNWFYDEYQVFWRKKALTRHSKTLPVVGQDATPAAA